MKAALEMNKTANTIFKDIYPVIVNNILKDFKRKSGICLDIGSGPASMAIEMAKISDFKIYTIDISESMNKIAKENIIENKLEDRIEQFLGNVENLNFKDNSIDLIISRGSVYFWEDHVKAFSEIKRVLKKDGMAFIGGGFGNKELKEKIIKELREKRPDWESASKKRFDKFNLKIADEICMKAGINNFSKIEDDRGNWIIIQGSDENEM